MYQQTPSPYSSTQKENFLQRQKRLYGKQTQQIGQQTGAYGSTTPSTASGTSPVGADGRLTSSPPPQQPAQPQPAPAQAQPPAPQPQPQAAPPPAQPYQYQQFQAPQQQYTEGMAGNLAGYMMANPYSMSDENVAQMQAQQREQAAIMARDAATARSRDAAARGVLGGGNDLRNERRASDALVSSILSGNRDVALQKMMQDKEDERNALAAGNSYLDSQLGRSLDAFQGLLAGQKAQGDENFQRYQLGTDNDLRSRQLDIQKLLGEGGLDVDRSKLKEEGRQFDLSNALDTQRFLESQRQFNQDMGFKYTDLQQQQQNQMMNWLRSVYGA